MFVALVYVSMIHRVWLGQTSIGKWVGFTRIFKSAPNFTYVVAFVVFTSDVTQKLLQYKSFYFWRNAPMHIVYLWEVKVLIFYTTIFKLLHYTLNILKNKQGFVLISLEMWMFPRCLCVHQGYKLLIFPAKSLKSIKLSRGIMSSKPRNIKYTDNLLNLFRYYY